MKEYTTEEIRVITAGLLSYRDIMVEKLRDLQSHAITGIPHMDLMREEKERNLFTDAKMAQELGEKFWGLTPADIRDENRNNAESEE